MATSDRIAEAIVELSSGTAIFSVCDNEEDSIQWLEGTTPIAPEVIRAKIVEREYRFARKPLYPEIKDQLDMIYDDQADGTRTFKDTSQAIKDANPKP